MDLILENMEIYIQDYTSTMIKLIATLALFVLFVVLFFIVKEIVLRAQMLLFYVFYQVSFWNYILKFSKN